MSELGQLRCPGLAALILWLAASSLAPVAAADEHVLDLAVEGIVADVKSHALTRPDPDGELDPEALLQSDEGFNPFDARLDDQAPATWLKLRLAAPADADGRYVLRVAQRFFERLDVWLPRADGTHAVVQAGVDDGHDALNVGRQFVFNAHVPPGATRDVLLRVKTVQNSLRPLEMWLQDETSYSQNRAMSYLAYGLYFGILLALIFHNFVLYLNLRQRGHLLYVLAMMAVTGMMLLDSGLVAAHWLPAGWQGVGFRLNVVFVLLSYVLTAWFFQVFVHTHRYVPGFHKAVTVGIVLLALITLVLSVSPTPFVLPALLVVQPILVGYLILLLVASLLAGIRGSTEGKIFFAAWLFVFIGSFVRLFMSLNLVARTDVLEHALYVGSVCEASILALGLSYRVRQLRERHAQALREQHKAARLSNLDPLTNAYNRRFLQNFLGNVLSESHADSLGRAVLILDLDNFKEVNDNHGHAAGDAILRHLVGRCQQVLRESDVLCRLGGDEFVIVLSDEGQRNGLEVARRLIDEIAQAPFRFEAESIFITSSIGVVTSISPKCTVGDILRMADQALYQAKQAGRNRATLFDPDRETPFRHGASQMPEKLDEEQQQQKEREE